LTGSTSQSIALFFLRECSQAHLFKQSQRATADHAIGCQANRYVFFEVFGQIN
jgi:hypothetical protein